ncbi:MAG: bifunctional (p)ppGpp synthetase/guanosine-3',5'-bis(diphosphate) 3'-pyrophosphohydrolase [Actinobacteria bacterium]|jgi:GTP pyrophosphokinase|nr:bifunctional (p)ppGpp synthetase/guanosine-3',5'-bis(diphosphate) 3'-pyrophosphohydrolase [Actinomycetota bacterium]
MGELPISVNDAIKDYRNAVRPSEGYRAVADRLVADMAMRLDGHVSTKDSQLITKALEIATAAHAGQFRCSGESFINHPIEVARVAISIGMDPESVAAALLHDVVEDSAVSLEELAATVGPKVAFMVDGLTKLERLRFDSDEARQAATFRKMLVAMASDWRVIVLKLADRLHNLRTIAVMPRESQKRTAQETLDVYAPLAHRLGIQEIKWQLEDLSFATLHPRRYAQIAQMVSTRAPEREEYLGKVVEDTSKFLATAGIVADVHGRPKHLWSIYEKMVVRGKEFEEIYDLVGIRIIVETERDCWAALGCLHSIWTPIPGRFKDYVNVPKFNLYQSLHTTVVGPGGKPIEVQIRTFGMHRRAEHGIAAHWDYKESRVDARKVPGISHASDAAWMGRLSSMQQETADPVEFMESLRMDLAQDEVYVFTPKGKVIELAAGSTPVDFAYAIHTEVGHRCIGAKVNGRLVPLDSKLKSADTVEVITSRIPSAGPSRDWAQFVVSSKARSKIRQWFSKERREDAIDLGREELTKALRRENLPLHGNAMAHALEHVSAGYGYQGVDALHASIGEGHQSAWSVAHKIARELRGDGQPPAEGAASALAGTPRSNKAVPGIYVEGLDDVMVHLARCCSPIPGDDLVGFVTRGRGVSVHRSGCSNANALKAAEGERLMDVEWRGAGHDRAFNASIELLAFNRSHLLADVAQVVAEHHLDIVSSHSNTRSDRVSRMSFEVVVAEQSQVSSLLASLKRLDGIFEAYRLMPGRNA